MENKLKIYEKEELKDINNLQKTKSNDYMGFIYAIEYGNKLKIGSSKQPYTRITSLKRQAEKYDNLELGRFTISREHTNYVDNEKIIDNYFKDRRKEATELFDLTIEEFVQNFDNIKLQVYFKM